MSEQQFRISYDGGLSETASLHDIEQWPEMSSPFNWMKLQKLAEGKLRRLSTSCYGIPCDVELVK
jgi:hypothetical protein